MNVTVSDVLGSLFNSTDTVCFRVFDDKKGGVFQGSKLSCECGKYKSIEETLKNHNAMNRGIFFVVNYGGQDDDSITRINAQFVEIAARTARSQMMGKFLDTLKKNGVVEEFDEVLWGDIVDYVTADCEKKLVFTFRNGVEIII